MNLLKPIDCKVMTRVVEYNKEDDTDTPIEINTVSFKGRYWGSEIIIIEGMIIEKFWVENYETGIISTYSPHTVVFDKNDTDLLSMKLNRI